MSRKVLHIYISKKRDARHVVSAVQDVDGVMNPEYHTRPCGRVVEIDDLSCKLDIIRVRPNALMSFVDHWWAEIFVFTHVY